MFLNFFLCILQFLNSVQRGGSTRQLHQRDVMAPGPPLLNTRLGCISRPTCRVTPPREPNFWNFLVSRTDLMDDSNLHRIAKCLLLGGRWLDSKFTCLNSIQSAQLHKNVRQKTKLCHLFLICITIFSEINATNRKQNHLPRFLHNFADWIEFKHVIS